MRAELAKLNGKRRRFKGVFVRFGKKAGYKEPLITILLKDVVYIASGKVVADHLWFTMGKRFSLLELKEGDVIRFDARVTSYVKGYRDRGDDKPLETDFRLSFPSNLVKFVI